MIELIRKSLQWQPLRYVISGGSGAVANLITLFIVVEFFHIWYLLGTIIAFLVAFAVSFTLQKFFTFRNQSRENIGRQSAVYFVIQIINLFVNTVLMYLSVDIVGIHYLISQVIVGAIIAFYSFFVFKRLVFAARDGYNQENQ